MDRWKSAYTALKTSDGGPSLPSATAPFIPPITPPVTIPTILRK
jgi:hypothetical protein